MELEEERRIGGSETRRATWSRWRPCRGLQPGEGLQGGEWGAGGPASGSPARCFLLPPPLVRAHTAAAPQKLGLWGGGRGLPSPAPQTPGLGVPRGGTPLSQLVPVKARGGTGKQSRL